MLSGQLRKQQSQALQFCSLQLPFRGIKVINNVPACVRFVVRLNLSGNHLVSLNGIHQFHNLEAFLFDYNHVALPAELAKITNRFFLKQLSFIANPLYYAGLSKQALARMGFTRLQRLNELERVHASPPAHRLAERTGKSANLSVAETDFTARRRPAYRHSPDADCLTDKKVVGKIYNTRTATGRRRAEKEEPARQTRESTTRQSVEAGEPRGSRSPPAREEGEVQPFEQSSAESGETAKFSEASELQRVGEQFLGEEKERLADCYHKRNSLEKCFRSWHSYRSKRIEDELEAHRGELANNTLETLHFSLIKLRHQFVARP